MIKPTKLFFVDEHGYFGIDGRKFFSGSMKEAVDEIFALSKTSRSHLVVTPNIDQVINLQSSPSLAQAYSDASMLTLDGAPLALVARALGANPVTRVTGADLLPSICASPLFKGKRIVITGGSDKTLDVAIRNLSEMYPEVDIVGIPFPHVSSIKNSDCLLVSERLQQLKPDVVFACLGSPKQEEWFLHWKDSLPSAVYIGAGAAVDFAAGTVRRAPGWAQRSGLEWVFRLISEPRRLAHRYLVKGPQILPIAMESYKRQKVEICN